MQKNNYFPYIAVGISFAVIGILMLMSLGVFDNLQALTTQNTEKLSLLTVFLTGLLTGGLTCLAVQGGLLAATLTNKEEDEFKETAVKSGNAYPILAFLVSKLAAYTVLGFFLGMLGSFFELSIGTRAILQFAVVIFMLGTAGNLLNLHPIFRYFVIQPPKFMTRMVRNRTRSKSLFAPGLLGAFTVFIPCGTTQAMMALAIASGSAMLGGAIMFAFIIGTSPLFFILGYFTTRMGGVFEKRFTRIAAITIVLLALYNLDGALALSGSKVTFKSIVNLLPDAETTNARTVVPVQDSTIEIVQSGYSPSILNVKAGSDVNLKVVNKNGFGCQQAFVIPQLGFQKIIRPGQTETFAFKAPAAGAEIPFMCSMGMYRGSIRVI